VWRIVQAPAVPVADRPCAIPDVHLAGILNMEYRVLGSLEIIRNDGAPAVFRPSEAQLVAVLLVFAGDPCSQGWLVRTLWGDTPPDKPERALATVLCRARAALGPGGCLRTLDDGAIRAEPGPQELDLARFLHLRAAGRQLLEQGRLRPASEKLELALACWDHPPQPDLHLDQPLESWRHPPMADLPGAPEVAARQTRLLEQRRLAWLTLADILLELGDHNRILPRLRARVIADPICEHAWAQLMLALYQGGRGGEALAFYGQARTELVTALGTEPGAELQDLRELILAGTPPVSRYSLRSAARSAAPGQATAGH
jgi:DNA-binding SARP family transcriptional activator